jgi:uncharacterized surface protein with fasciclin (FAS1) repeats
MKLKLLTTTAVLGLALTGTSFADHHGEAKDSEMKDKKEASEKLNIVETAAGNEDFSTLVAAIQAAGLAETLSGEGPFTVFAPNEAAFAKLPEGTLGMLLLPENKDKLTQILTYHVVPAKVMAADVKTMMAPTVEGTEASVKVTDDGVMVDEAKVIKTDIEASNGVIHVIDTVLMPKEDEETEEEESDGGY